MNQGSKELPALAIQYNATVDLFPPVYAWDNSNHSIFIRDGFGHRWPPSRTRGMRQVCEPGSEHMLHDTPLGLEETDPPQATRRESIRRRPGSSRGRANPWLGSRNPESPSPLSRGRGLSRPKRGYGFDPGMWPSCGENTGRLRDRSA